MIRVGCVSEKGDVALTPDQVRALADDGFVVLVQRYSGLHQGFEDSAYIAAGAQMRFDALSIARDADVLVKYEVTDADRDLLEYLSGKTLLMLMELKDDVLTNQLVRDQIATMTVSGIDEGERLETLLSVLGQLAQLQGMEYDRKLGQLRALAQTTAPISAVVSG